MARKEYGGIDAVGNKITNVAAGTAATDAVNKAQLDAVDEVAVAAAQPGAASLELWVDTSTISTNVSMLTVSTSPASGIGTDIGHLWVQY